MTIYNEAVAAYFHRPVGKYAGDHEGQAGSIPAGTWIGFRAGVREGCLTNLDFRVFACPHIIAVCHWLREDLEGRPITALREFKEEDARQKFDIPVEKAGKLLILQDALAGLLASIQAQANSG